jgi:hypothetical protein
MGKYCPRGRWQLATPTAIFTYKMASNQWRVEGRPVSFYSGHTQNILLVYSSSKILSLCPTYA